MLPEHEHLSFQPVVNASPQRLSVAQIGQYNRLGYVAPFNIYSADEVNTNRRYFDSLLAQLDGRDAYSIDCYQARCEGIWDICNEPRILDLVEDMLGPNIICWASHFFCKLPFDRKTVPWHQDAVYWHLAPARTVTVWLAIDDADDENSAMEFLPGTHDRGVLAWRKPEGDVVSVLDREIIGLSDLGDSVSNSLNAGQISLHADMLAHGSRPNDSSRRRCGLTLRFCPPEVGFTDERWASGVEAIICRGEDHTGKWRHHPRPESDDVSVKYGPGNFGGN